MFWRTGMILLAAVTACGAFGDGAADKAFAVKEAKAFDDAVMKKDSAWFDKIAAPDYVEVGVKGKKKTREESIGQMAAMLSMGTVTQISSKVLSVSSSGDKILAKIRTTMTVTISFAGRPKPATLKGDRTYEETWTRKDAKMHLMREIANVTTINGRPFGAGM